VKAPELRGTSVPYILWFSLYYLEDFEARK